MRLRKLTKCVTYTFEADDILFTKVCVGFQKYLSWPELESCSIFKATLQTLRNSWDMQDVYQMLELDSVYSRPCDLTMLSAAKWPVQRHIVQPHDMQLSIDSQKCVHLALQELQRQISLLRQSTAWGCCTQRVYLILQLHNITMPCLANMEKHCGNAIAMVLCGLPS